MNELLYITIILSALTNIAWFYCYNKIVRKNAILNADLDEMKKFGINMAEEKNRLEDVAYIRDGSKFVKYIIN